MIFIVIKVKLIIVKGILDLVSVVIVIIIINFISIKDKLTFIFFEDSIKEPNLFINFIIKIIVIATNFARIIFKA